MNLIAGLLISFCVIYGIQIYKKRKAEALLIWAFCGAMCAIKLFGGL